MTTTTEHVRRRTRALALGACLVLASTGVTAGPTARAASQLSTANRLEARLVPSGDPDGSGHATFRLFGARHRVCATVTWQDIATPNAAHIHRRSDGGIVVDLTGSVTGGARCAAGVSRPLIRRILAHPRRYYFNVHNAEHPAGAIQGRLHH